MSNEMVSQLDRVTNCVTPSIERSTALPAQGQRCGTDDRFPHRRRGTGCKSATHHGGYQAWGHSSGSQHCPGASRVAVVRGVLVPVFNLAALLGLPPSGEPQWFMLLNRETPVAFAFDGLEGRVEVERAHLYVDETGSRRKHIHQLAEIGSTVRQ